MARRCGICEAEPAQSVPELGFLCEKCTQSYFQGDVMEATTVKAANGEPIFTLRAQDISAPIIVDQWAAMNETALGKDHPKIVGARAIANLMRQWPNRRQAD